MQWTDKQIVYLKHAPHGYHEEHIKENSYK